MRKLLLILFIIICPNASFAQVTVEFLKSRCEDTNPDQINQSFCLAYVNGAGEMLYDYSINMAMGAQKKTYEQINAEHLCWDRIGTTTTQLRDIFLQWARNNPQNYQWKATQGLLQSYMETFCPTK